MRSFRATVAGAAVVLALAVASAGEARSAGPAELPRSAAWARHVREVDQALAVNEIGRAVRALQEAHVAALGSRGWEGLVEVGGAALRVGQATDNQTAGTRKARQAYLEALLRARGQASLDGVLAASEAFAMLGDREVAQNGLRIAEGIAAKSASPDSMARLEALRERIAGNGSAAGAIRMQ